MALIPVPMPSNIRLKNACAGKSASAGGMNLPEIVELATSNGIEIKEKTRAQILAELCPKLLTSAVHASAPALAPAPASAPAPALAPAPAPAPPVGIAVGKKISLKKPAASSISALTPVPATIIKSNCDNLSVFNQVSNICWFHTGAHIAFFADGMRDVTWTRLFELERVGDYYIPRKIRKTTTGDKARRAETLMILEIIRQAVEVTAEAWSGSESKGREKYQIYQGKESKVKNPPVGPHRLKRQASSDVCDLTVQNFICNLKREWCAPRAGGFAVPMINTVIDDNGLTSLIEHPKGFTFYNQKTNTPDVTHVSAHDKNGIAVLIDWEGSSHVISFFRCGSSWVLFDNECTGKRYTALLENTDKTTVDELFKAYGLLFPRNIIIGYAMYKALTKATKADIVSAVPGRTADKVENFFTALRDDEVPECLDLVMKYNNMLAPLFGLTPEQLFEKLVVKLT